MELNLKKPIVFFDLETTGVNVTTDRIVEIAMVKISTNNEQEVKTYKVNPTVPIPIEASLVHGIYDKDVENEPTFNQLAKEISKFMEGCDLGGYNLLRFDVPLLAEEFLRVDLDFEVKNRNIVDAQHIFYMMEPRTLTAAYKFYCNKELENAHSAEADTFATYEVLKAQVERYEGETIKNKDGNEITPIVNDMQALGNLIPLKHVDLMGRIVYNDQGIEVFNFGKHKGRPVSDVFEQEHGYYDWMMKSEFPLYTKKVLTQIKLKMGKL